MRHQQKRIVLETSAHKPAYKEQHLQNLKQVLPTENHTTSCDNLSASKLVTNSHDKAAVHTSTATKAEVEAKSESREDKKTSRHLGSSASSDQVSTNKSASVLPDLTEQSADSLVLKIMQELSDQLEQEKQLESRTHDATKDCSQPTRTVPLAVNTREKLRASHNQRQFHVDVQGNMCSNLAANSYMDRRGMALGLCQGAALPTAHLLPRPISLASNNALGNSIPGWTWDPAEGILTSDVGNVPGSVSTTINRSIGELTPTVGWGDAMGLHGGGQVVGDMAAYQVANPGLYMPECVPDAVRLTQHGGTGVFWPGMAPDAGMQTHNANLTVAGRMAGGHFEYRPEPVTPPGLALGWSQGHPASAGTAPYWEQIYYV